MGPDESYFHDSIVIMDISDQAKRVMYNFKPGTVILDHFGFWKISQNILLVFPFGVFNDQFPYGETFSGICMGLPKVIQSFQVYDQHPASLSCKFPPYKYINWLANCQQNLIFWALEPGGFFKASKFLL
jgi:hypothetical protein